MKLKIGYQDVEVKFSDMEEYGCYHSDKGVIKIQEGTEGKEYLNTLIHEVLHAIYYTYGLKRLPDHTDEKEEHIVTTLGNALTQVITDNPELIDVLYEYRPL